MKRGAGLLERDVNQDQKTQGKGASFYRTSTPLAIKKGGGKRRRGTKQEKP